MTTRLEYATEQTPSFPRAPARGRRNGALGCLVVMLVPVLVLALIVWAKVTDHSASRVEREHGLKLPPSARGFVCGGTAWIGFLDRGASSMFDVDRDELQQFLAQLTPHEGGIYFGYVDESGVVRYDCESPTGDRLYVFVRTLSDGGGGGAGIELSTDWD